MYSRMIMPLFSYLSLSTLLTKNSMCVIWYFLVLLPGIYLLLAHLFTAIWTIFSPAEDDEEDYGSEDNGGNI